MPLNATRFAEWRKIVVENGINSAKVILPLITEE
ncbi:hypothetical protein CTB91_02278 [Dickeya solani]|uniref:Uncharacterized protein n=1 Tax=Dickeya solani D s0432-1 TaxID=1231725 RepID=A0AAV3KB57_9GAMM|nr:hypothetical protein CTB91_02278 [Dickeya solani]ERO57700.1 hypothetical protein A544_2277 [Dickeya solani D s0432-1]AYQ52251.1 hypothetical protein DSOL99_02283 [Dickeya solani]NUA40252.1 hypothetical protein [Dickeya solani]NUA46406.1 hypothetical protein [Dickeya solani]